MNINIYDHYPTSFKANPAPPTSEGYNMNRLDICQEHATLTLWLTEAQARELRAALDKLYPPLLPITPVAGESPVSEPEWEASIRRADQEAPRRPEHSMDDPSEPPATDLAAHLFEMATALNRIAAGKEEAK